MGFLLCFRADDASYYHTDLYKTKALVDHNGSVIWTAPVTWKVACTFDVTWFPVDKQVRGASVFERINISLATFPDHVQQY